MDNTALPKINNTCSHKTSVKFIFDDYTDISNITIFTPPDVSHTEVYETINAANDYLIKNETEYDENGQNIDTLMAYIEKTKGWTWKELTMDIDISLY